MTGGTATGGGGKLGGGRLGGGRLGSAGRLGGAGKLGACTGNAAVGAATTCPTVVVRSETGAVTWETGPE